MKLRVQDLNFDMEVLTVHDGKGKKDRTVPLPEVLVPELMGQLERVEQTHREDLAAGYAGTFLPDSLYFCRLQRQLMLSSRPPAA
jgi:integrase